MSYLTDRKLLTLHDLAKMRHAGEKLVMLTCYDASFAAIVDRAGVDIILVGDSLGNVVQGRSSTLGVTMEHMIYHTECVVRASVRPMVVVDLPFGAYQESPEQAFRNACRLMQAGAHMVKLEGGAEMAPTVRFLVERGVPVCGHVGLTPQSVNQLGGYRVQGRTQEGAKAVREDSAALEDAGASLLVLEMVPATLAAEVASAARAMATIGIGAGSQCAGQVLVLYDVIGVYGAKKLRFAKNFLDGAAGIAEAIGAYVKAVKDGSFPAAEHSF